MEEDHFHKTVLRHLESQQTRHYLTGPLQKKKLGYPPHTINGTQCTEPDLALLGMDCEMVLTDQGLEICQVVIINQFGHILYNRSFKPQNKIIDYITHITGLSECNFHADVRAVLAEKDIEEIQLICSGKVIVGHDLANDLKVLPIKHKDFIDTLALYPHNYGLPFKTKLKNLAYQLLNRPIQWDSHNPIEDSLAAIDIVKQHISQGKGTIQQDSYKINNFESIDELIKQAQLDKEKIVAFILRGSRALKLQLEEHGYFSDWDYVCVYHTTAPINGRLIKLHNIDITIYDEATYYKIIEGNDLALLELYYLPQQCQYINKLSQLTLDLSLLRETLGYHLGKCDRKVKRTKTMQEGQKRNWKVLKTYHMKARFLNYFMQFYANGRIADVMETNVLWEQLKERYIADFNFHEAEKWIIQQVTDMYNEVRNLKKTNRPLGHNDQKFNKQRYGRKESNLADPHKRKEGPEIQIESRRLIKDEVYISLQKYILSVPKIVNPLNLSLVDQLLTYGLQRMQSFRITYKRHRRYPNLIQFHYMQSADFHLQICKESRGLILDATNDYAVVSLPYFKFFDYNDKQYAQLSKFNFADCKLYEKFDGSFAALYFYGGQWEVSSSKVPDGQNRYCFARLQTEKEFKQQFFKIFYSAGYPLPSEQDCDKTFIFELLSKDHIIVVRRGTSEIRLHGVNDRTTGAQEDHQSYANKYGWMAAIALQKSVKDIEEVVALAKGLNPLKQEGYVLCDASYCRLKVKCPDYLRINWLGQLNLNAEKNPKRYLLTEIVLAGQVEVFCQYCPEWEKPIRQWMSKIKYLNNKCIQIYNAHPNLSGRQLAMEISKQPKYLHPFLFQLFANFEKWVNRLEYLMPAKRIYTYLQQFKIDERVD